MATLRTVLQWLQSFSLAIRSLQSLVLELYFFHFFFHYKKRKLLSLFYSSFENGYLLFYVLDILWCVQCVQLYSRLWNSLVPIVHYPMSIAHIVNIWALSRQCKCTNVENEWTHNVRIWGLWAVDTGPDHKLLLLTNRIRFINFHKQNYKHHDTIQYKCFRKSWIVSNAPYEFICRTQWSNKYRNFSIYYRVEHKHDHFSQPNIQRYLILHCGNINRELAVDLCYLCTTFRWKNMPSKYLEKSRPSLVF